MLFITSLLECDMSKKIIHKMKPEHIEEAKDMFEQILKEVESGDQSTTTITIFMKETGIAMRISEGLK